MRGSRPKCLEGEGVFHLVIPSLRWGRERRPSMLRAKQGRRGSSNQ